MEEDNKETSAVSPETRSDSIVIRKDALWKYSTFVLSALVVVLAITAFGGNKGVTGNAVNTRGNVAPQPSGPPPTPSHVTATADDDARIGSADAPVQIIEFSDFQCPFCGRAEPTVKQILSEYGDKVSLVYRDFPLTSLHPNAQNAAEASECVRDQGGDKAYWKYHDKLFSNQQSLEKSNLIKWAKEQGYDISSCLSSGKFTSEVQKDARDAQAAGGRGTPYFVINGKPLSGAQPFSAFKQVIDGELA